MGSNWHRCLASTLAAALMACGGGGGGGAATGVGSGRLTRRGFGPDGTLEEADRIDHSASPQWWLNSGALFTVSGPQGSTIQGDLPPSSPWYRSYARSNPSDSDGGAHPGNLFRLIDRSAYGELDEEVRFRITAIHPSGSPNRNASNGVHLLGRLANPSRAYYAGIRVDGAAVVKKRSGGAFATLGYRPLYPGSPGAYDRNANPNLIPTGRPITLALSIRNQPDGGVSLQLWVDGNAVLDVTDGAGAGPFTAPGLAGVASDFMDVGIRPLRCGRSALAPAAAWRRQPFRKVEGSNG